MMQYRYARKNVQEVKLVDTLNTTQIAIDDFAAANSNCLTLLNGIKSGSGFYNRIGSKIGMKSLSLNIAIIWKGANGSATGEYLRLMVVYDRQVNHSSPTQPTICAGYDKNGTASTSLMSPINPIYRDRFLILLDQFFWFSDTSTSGGLNTILPGPRVPIKKFFKLRGLETTFNSGTAGDVTDIETGALFLVAGSSLAATPTGLKIQVSARLRFYD